MNIQKEMSEEKMWKYMLLSECIVFLCKSVITPFKIGLALQLYHEFGSKQLIETLHAHGDTGVPRNNLLKHYTHMGFAVHMMR